MVTLYELILLGGISVSKGHKKFTAIELDPCSSLCPATKRFLTNGCTSATNGGAGESAVVITSANSFHMGRTRGQSLFVKHSQARGVP